MIRVLIAAAVVVSFVSVAPSASAGPGCVHRGIGHAAQHGGQVSDDAYHLSRGEQPTCDSDEKKDESQSSVSEPNLGTPAISHPKNSSTGDDHERKSRFCRKRWFC